MEKRALITGITGQDGSYLAEQLLEKGYEVHGVIRRMATENPSPRMSRLTTILESLKLHPGDIQNYPRMTELFEKIKPDECYHLAAQSFVHESFEDSFTTRKNNIDGTHNLLSAMHRKAPNCKFYFAGSSEMFGKVSEVPQKETTGFHPRSPYGVSKVAGFYFAMNYRESYNLFISSGILFNHESPRRGFEFVTRKITQGIGKMHKNQTNVLALGNLEAKRDWGFAGDYTHAMWMMLQQKIPEDYVIATGRSHTIKDFIDIAFSTAKMDYELVDLHEMTPEDADNKINHLSKEHKGDNFVVQHPKFYRPAEVSELLGDASKAKKELGWESKVKFEELVEMMVLNDLK